MRKERDKTNHEWQNWPCGLDFLAAVLLVTVLIFALIGVISVADWFAMLW